MDFGVRFAFNLLFLTCLDICWLRINFKLFPGVIYSDNALSQRNFRDLFTITIACFVCWICSALYLAGHHYDTLLHTAAEAAWIGSLVYAVFNATIYAMNKDWFIFPTATVDTLWGTALFTTAAVLTDIIADIYF